MRRLVVCRRRAFILDAAISAAEETGECWFEPELHRLKGELLLRWYPDEKAHAEAALRLAVERVAARAQCLVLGTAGFVEFGKAACFARPSRSGTPYAGARLSYVYRGARLA